jgi:hypothetical protein
MNGFKIIVEIVVSNKLRELHTILNLHEGINNKIETQ